MRSAGLTEVTTVLRDTQLFITDYIIPVGKRPKLGSQHYENDTHSSHVAHAIAQFMVCTKLLIKCSLLPWWPPSM